MISRLAFLKAWLLIWLIVVAGSLFLLTGKVSTVEANPPATGNALLSRIPSPTPSPACGPAWRVVDTPNSSLWNNDLADIALVSANDAWAVGHYQAIITPTVQTRALIE